MQYPLAYSVQIEFLLRLVPVQSLYDLWINMGVYMISEGFLYDNHGVLGPLQ